MHACRLTAADIKSRLLKIGLTFPRELTLTITSICNLHCRHCLPESGPDTAHNSHIPFEDLHNVINRWHDIGLTEICITGGEPLLHPEWQKILSCCCSKPGIAKVKLQSNGTLIDKKITKILLQREYQKVSLYISLDGYSSKEHDRIRGEGNFTKTLERLRSLQEAGLSERTTLFFTETASNFEQLPQLLQLCEDFNISGLISNTLIRGGRAADGNGVEMPSPQQYTNLIQLYEQSSEFRKLYNRKGNISAIEWYRHRNMRSTTDTCSCMATPYINAQGRLYPCTLLPLPWLAIDEIWTKSFLDILDELEKKWAQLHSLSKKRPAWIAECRNCIGRDHCQSGCLGRSFPHTGDFLLPEDRCLHRKAVYRYKNS